MNSTYLRIIFVFTDIILPLVTGYYLKQKKIMSGEVCNLLIRINIVIFCTILTLLSFWVLPLSSQLLWLPLLGVLFTIVPGFIGWALFARRFKSYLQQGAYVVSALLSNIGAVAGLCAFIVYGEIGYAYVQLVATFQNMLLVILCFPLAQYYFAKETASLQQTRLHLSFREMFLTLNQVPVLGMAAGILFQLAGIARPPVLGTVSQILVHLVAWISMVPVGYLIDFGQARTYYRRVWDMVPLRFIIVPGLFYFCMKNIFTDQVLLGTLIITAAAPGAVNSVVTARLYKLDVDLTIAAFLLTMVVFVLVVFPAFFFYVAGGGQF